MRPIRYGIIGVGAAARLHAAAIQHTPGSELIALCRTSGGDTVAAAASFGVPCHNHPASVINLPEVDAVCICSPNGLHAEQAMLAAQAGKHVLVEQPIALTLADADALLLACQRTGVWLGVAAQGRTEPQFRAIHAAIAEGELGQLIYSNAIMPSAYRAIPYATAWRGTRALDGGLLFSQGLHLIDLMIWFMGDILSAHAHVASYAQPSEIEDTITASVRFSTGALGSIGMTQAAGLSFPQRLGIYGSTAGVQIEGDHVIRAKGDGLHARLSDLPSSAGLVGEIGAFGLNATGHARLIEDFSDAIRTGRPPLVPGEAGRRTLAAVLAIYAATGI